MITSSERHIYIEHCRHLQTTPVKGSMSDSGVCMLFIYSPQADLWLLKSATSFELASPLLLFNLLGIISLRPDPLVKVVD